MDSRLSDVKEVIYFIHYANNHETREVPDEKKKEYSNSFHRALYFFYGLTEQKQAISLANREVVKLLDDIPGYRTEGWHKFTITLRNLWPWSKPKPTPGIIHDQLQALQQALNINQSKFDPADFSSLQAKISSGITHTTPTPIPQEQMVKEIFQSALQPSSMPLPTTTLSEVDQEKIETREAQLETEIKNAQQEVLQAIKDFEVNIEKAPKREQLILQKYVTSPEGLPKRVLRINGDAKRCLDDVKMKFYTQEKKEEKVKEFKQLAANVKHDLKTTAARAALEIATDDIKAFNEQRRSAEGEIRLLMRAYADSNNLSERMMKFKQKSIFDPWMSSTSIPEEPQASLIEEARQTSRELKALDDYSGATLEQFVRLEGDKELKEFCGALKEVITIEEQNEINGSSIFKNNIFKAIFESTDEDVKSKNAKLIQLGNALWMTKRQGEREMVLTSENQWMPSGKTDSTQYSSLSMAVRHFRETQATIKDIQELLKVAATKYEVEE